MTYKEIYDNGLHEMENKQIPFPQNNFEFFQYCSYLKSNFRDKKITFLEIGSRHGGSLFMASRFLGNDATLISIELPNSLWGFEGTDHKLKEVVNDLKVEGFDSHLILGDSQLENTKDELIKIIGTEELDVLFIDADHTYNGVKKDWDLYSQLVAKGGIIIFHDILKVNELPEVEVWKLWTELKGKYPYMEFSMEYGIGILLNCLK